MCVSYRYKQFDKKLAKSYKAKKAAVDAWLENMYGQDSGKAKVSFSNKTTAIPIDEVL